MAYNETWLNHDMMEAVKVKYLDGNVFSQDNAGNLIGVLLTKGGVDYSGGGTVAANVIRADGATVAVSGALSGNVASVVLPQAAYAVPGVLSIIIKLTVNGEITTIAAVVANVYQSSTDTIVDPGTIIPSIETLIALIEEAIATIPPEYAGLTKSVRDGFDLQVFPGEYSTDQQQLFTASQIAPGKTLYYDFTTTQAAAWLAFYDAGGHWLNSIGKTASASGATSYTGEYILPSNFSYCAARCATDGKLTINYLYGEDYIPEQVLRSIRSHGLIGDTSVYSDLNTLPKNSFMTFFSTAASNILHKPADVTGLFSVLTMNCDRTTYTGAVQILLSISTQTEVYFRVNVSGTWKDWRSDKVNPKTINVRSDGSGDYTSIVDAIMYTMNNPATEYTPYIIDVGAGTFDMTGAVAKISGGELVNYGLFIAPYTTIQGKGTDKTKLTFNYTGSDDDIMSNVSALNVVYESALKNMTIECKNIRYVFHADYGMDQTTPIAYNAFTMENVVAIHKGFDSGLTPTYKVPAVWGQGLHSANIRNFINCKFISVESMPWFCHDRVGATAGSEIMFDGCEFITYANNVPSIRFVSWGADIKNYVNIKNCTVNSFVSLGVVTSYNANAVIDYYVEATGIDTWVIEDTTNDSHKNRNYTLFGTVSCINKSGSKINKFDPVSILSGNGAYTYDGSGLMGIATNDAVNGELVNVKVSGFVTLTSGVTVGRKISYSGGSWHEDANGNLIVLGTNYCRFI